MIFKEQNISKISSNTFAKLEMKQVDLIELTKKSWYEDLQIIQQFFIVVWAQVLLEHKAGNFIESSELYEQYKNFYEKQYCNNLIVSKRIFYKEIYIALLSPKIIHTRSRQDGKRGIKGISFKTGCLDSLKIT